jgi:hypothetical protein
MHSDRTPSNLYSIQDQIVVLATYLECMEWNQRATQMPVTTQRQRLRLRLRTRTQVLTSEIRPSKRAWTSCQAGAVKGWCVLLHLPFARRSFSASARVNKGNSVIQRKCGVRLGVYVPTQQVISQEGSIMLLSTHHATAPAQLDEVSADQVQLILPKKRL